MLKGEKGMRCFLGANSEFEGALTSKGALRIEGTVRGRIEADQVVLNPTALVIGEIVAREIIVGGRIEGNLKASELVEITSQGRIQGEIVTNKLLVAQGGEFNGRIEMKTAQGSVAQPDFSEAKGAVRRRGDEIPPSKSEGNGDRIATPLVQQGSVN